MEQNSKTKSILKQTSPSCNTTKSSIEKELNNHNEGSIKQEIFKQLFLFINGVRDSLKIWSSLKKYYFSRQENVSQKIHNTLSEMTQRIIVNFLLCIFLFAIIDYFFPSISFWLKFVHYPLLIILYIWIIISSLFWFGDIVENAQKIERDLFNNAEAILYQKNMENSNIEQTGSYALKKQIFMIVYILTGVLFTQLSSFLPYIGPLMLFLVQSTYYAMFLFMLKWSYNNYILCYFEQHISYFSGFGCMISIITNLFQCSLKDGILKYLLSDGIYYIVFTIYIFIAVNSRPPVIPYLKNISVFQFFKTVTSSGTEKLYQQLFMYPNNQQQQQQQSQQQYGTLKNMDSTFVQFINRLNNDKQFKKSCKKKTKGLFAPVRILTNLANYLLGMFLKKSDFYAK